MDTTVITTDTYSQHWADLEDYHRLRHDIFVSAQGLGRTDLYAAADQETDIWDLPHFRPAHFLVRHEGRAVAVGRMTSSIMPTMMDVLYPQFVTGDIPKDQNTWEVQRLGVAPDLPYLLREIALSNVLIAMERFSFKNRIHQLMLLTFVGIAEKRLTDMAPMGPVCQHLGFPHIAVIGTPDPALHASRRRELAKFEASIIQEKAA